MQTSILIEKALGKWNEAALSLPSPFDRKIIVINGLQFISSLVFDEKKGRTVGQWELACNMVGLGIIWTKDDWVSGPQVKAAAKPVVIDDSIVDSDCDFLRVPANKWEKNTSGNWVMVPSFG